MQIWQEQVGTLLEQVRQKQPLVHQITNYVTVNDCANITLAVGASPVMADALEEVCDIAGIASALVLNIGTLNARTVQAMLAAGKKANECGIPVVLDPVGAGASAMRSETARRILREVRVAVVRGNVSELSALAGLAAATRGVDAAQEDAATDSLRLAERVSGQYRCVAAVTGAVDSIADGTRAVQVHNGHPMLARITGTGCMSTALVGAFAGTGADAFAAAAAALAVMGLAGEQAWQQAGAQGTGSFRAALLDAVSRMDADTLQKGARLYEA